MNKGVHLPGPLVLDLDWIWMKNICFLTKMIGNEIQRWQKWIEKADVLSGILSKMEPLWIGFVSFLY